MTANPTTISKGIETAMRTGSNAAVEKNPKIEKFIDKVDRLPPSPRLLIKLLDLFKQPDQDLHETVKLISYDPSYTAEILKKCNSAYFSSGEPVQDIFEAVSRLGVEELHKIVTAMFASEAILRPGQNSFVEILWAHSVSVAVAASVLAEQVEESPPTAFTAGLLHEIGKVIMITADESNFVQAVQNSGIFKRPIYLTEKELFGFDHTEVGACLLERWSLPPNIIAAVLHHHQLAGAEPFERLAAVVYVANILSHGTGETFANAPKSLAQASDALAILSLTPEQVVNLLPSMQEGLKKARALTRA